MGGRFTPLALLTLFPPLKSQVLSFEPNFEVPLVTGHGEACFFCDAEVWRGGRVMGKSFPVWSNPISSNLILYLPFLRSSLPDREVAWLSECKYSSKLPLVLGFTSFLYHVCPGLQDTVLMSDAYAMVRSCGVTRG